MAPRANVLLFGAVAGLLLTAGAWAYLEGLPTPAGALRPTSDSARERQASRAGSDVSAQKSQVVEPTPVVGTDTRPTAPPPRSLLGTEIDGALRADENGNFAPDADSVRLFEYYLSALGELAEETIRARLIEEIRARLPERAQSQAIGFLDSYLRYRQSAGELGRIAKNAEDLHGAVDALYALRRETFGSALADKLFGEDEKVRTNALERLLLAKQAGLSDQERKAQLAALDQELPESIRLARERAVAPLEARDRAQVMRAQGADEQAVYEMRAKELGPEAADRLAELDRKRADFQRRLDDFRAQRARVERDPKLRVNDKVAAIEALLEASFAPDERERARLLAR